MSSCTLFGHGDTPKEIERALKSALTDLIENKNVDTFYVGNNGNFDVPVRSALSDLSAVHSIEYYVVLVYLPKTESGYSDHTLFPEGIENTPPKFRITYRNKWMVDHSDYAVTYVKYPFGGAAKYKELAETKGKKIIELSVAK